MKNVVELEKKLTNFYNEVSGNLKIDIKSIDISNFNNQDDVLDYVNKIGFKHFDNELISNLIKMVEISNIKVIPLATFFEKYGKDTMLCKHMIHHHMHYKLKKHNFYRFDKRAMFCEYNKNWLELTKYSHTMYPKDPLPDKPGGAVCLNDNYIAEFSKIHNFDPNLFGFKDSDVEV